MPANISKIFIRKGEIEITIEGAPDFVSWQFREILEGNGQSKDDTAQARPKQKASKGQTRPSKTTAKKEKEKKQPATDEPPRTNQEKILPVYSAGARVCERDVIFMNYLAEEDSNQGFQDATAIDLESIESKGLLTGIIFRYQENNLRKKMDQDKKSELLLEMKTLIECFEHINR